MANRDIKTRFRLEGESEFRRAMKDSADAVKVLTSEQKLAQAQFEATGDAEQYMTDTTRILKDQIQEQEKAVAAAQAAVDKLKAKGVDPADKSMQQWNTRLNTAKTRLTQMRTQLDKTNGELGESKTKLNDGETEAREFGDELERVGKKIDFQNTITAIDNIKSRIETVLKTAARVGKEFWNLETDAGKWADDLATAAANAGLDVETYQSWQYASQFIDTDVSKITSSITRLEKDLGSENKELAKTFNQLGVRTRETGGKVRDATAVFWDVVDALGRIEDPTRRSILAQQVLGQGWKDLNPLIEAGSKAYKDMAQEGMETAVISAESVSKLGELNDAQGKLNSSIQKVKFESLAALAPTFTEVSTALNTAVTALNSFLQSQEGQEALGRLNDALSGVINSFLGEDNGKGTFEAIVNGASGAIESLNKGLDWISKNGDVVTGVAVALAAAWGGLTISKELLMVLQLLQALPISKLTAVFGSKGGEAAASAAAASAGKTAAAAAGMSAGADALLFGALPAAGVAAAAIVPVVMAEKHLREETTATLEAVRKSAVDAAEAIGKDAEAAVATVNAAVTALGVSKEHYDIFGQGVLADVREVNQALKETAQNTPEKYLSGKSQIMLERQQKEGLSGMQEDELLYRVMEEAAQSVTDPKTRQATDDLAGAISDALDDILAVQDTLDEGVSIESMEALYGMIDKIVDSQDLLDSLSQESRDLLGKYYDEESGFGAGSATQFTDAQQVLETLLKDLEGAYDRAMAAGKNTAAGFAQGLEDGTADAANAASALANATADSTESTLDIQSPSRVFEIIGENASVGLANGILAREGDVVAAAQAVAQAAEETLRQALDIHSPSRVFARLGAFTGEGFAQGVEGSLARVQQSVARMAGAAFRAPVSPAPAPYSPGRDPASAVFGPGSGAQAAQNINAVIMMDKKTVGYMVAPAVNEAIGAIIQEQRG